MGADLLFTFCSVETCELSPFLPLWGSRARETDRGLFLFLEESKDPEPVVAAPVAQADRVRVAGARGGWAALLATRAGPRSSQDDVASGNSGPCVGSRVGRDVEGLRSRPCRNSPAERADGPGRRAVNARRRQGPVTLTCCWWERKAERSGERPCNSLTELNKHTLTISPALSTPGIHKSTSTHAGSRT